MNNYINDPDRVRRHTPEELVRLLDRKTLGSVAYYAAQPREKIDARIQELRKEWSIDRVMQMKIATIGVTTILLSLTQGRKWGLLTCAVLGAFLMYSRTGYHPLLPILRELGVRTQAEIEREIYSLKVLRGDFANIPPAMRNAGSAEEGNAFRAVGV